MGSICCCLLGNREEGLNNANGSNSLIHNVMNQFGSILDQDDEGMVANPRPGSPRPSSTGPDPGITSSQHSGPGRSAANPQQNLESSKKSNGDKDKQVKFKKRSGRCRVNLKECQSESSASKVESEALYGYSAADIEDVCPTCLEEYTPENPKIVANCNHEFHLACIFEWMKRSECCPVCGKLMVFEETK